jgi:disulfide bond formation protein DsbB
MSSQIKKTFLVIGLLLLQIAAFLGAISILVLLFFIGLDIGFGHLFVHISLGTYCIAMGSCGLFIWIEFTKKWAKKILGE